MNTILIVMAMEEEAVPLLEVLPFTAWSKPLDPHLPAHAYTAEVDGLQVILAINGRDLCYQVASFGTDGCYTDHIFGDQHVFAGSDIECRCGRWIPFKRGRSRDRLYQ